MNTKKSNKHVYDECPMGKFFWIGEYVSLNEHTMSNYS